MLDLKTDRDILDAWSDLYRQMPELHPIIRPIFIRLPGVIDRERERRLIRGGFLVIAGHVTPNGTPSSFDVRSQTLPRRVYRVTAKRDQWKCIIIEDPGASTIATLCPDIASGAAPDFGHGRRCKHMIAAMLFDQLRKKEDVSETCDSETSKGSPHHEGPTCQPHSTTPPPETQSRRLVARYADGRPARYTDGTIVRYTAGGTAVEIPPSCW